MDICSVCDKRFVNTSDYLDHLCKTGFKPTEMKHQIRLDHNYAKISESAVKRGNNKQ